MRFGECPMRISTQLENCRHASEAAYLLSTSQEWTKPNRTVHTPVETPKSYTE